jgi:hypothetical protein
MKKIYTFVMSVLAAAVMSAQTPVTFTVDISGAGLTPSANGVHIAGSFQGWSPSATPLNDNGDGTFSVTLDLMPGHYEFKFINGNDWSFVEDVPNICQVELNGNDNRHIEVGADSTSYAVCYASCALCGTNAVLLRVDMSMVDVDGDGINAEVGEDISSAGVHIAGSFNNWTADSTILTPMGNNIYGVVLPLAAGDYQYKFINGNEWGFEENSSGACFTAGNRTITVAEPNILTEAVCFGACSTCLMPTNVTFRVNMSNETVSPNGVHIAGSFQNWSPGDMNWAMVDMGNNIYELTKPVPAGSYQYKFVNGNDWSGADNDNESLPAECNVNGNRSIDVTGASILIEYCYNQCTADCIIDPNPANVTFQVDMANMITSAAFNPSADTLWMISGATAPQWQAGRTVMTDADGDQVYECVVNISGPAQFQYKYLGGTAIVQDSINFEEGAGIDSTGCGIDNGVGGWNRTFVRTGVDEATGVYCFDQCTDCDGNPVIGVDEVALNNNVQVYPNPTEGLLNIAVQSTNTQDVKVEVYNAMGQFIMVEKFNKLAAGKNTLGLNLNNVPTGLYIVEVTGAHLNETFRVAVK